MHNLVKYKVFLSAVELDICCMKCIIYNKYSRCEFSSKTVYTQDWFHEDARFVLVKIINVV